MGGASPDSEDEFLPIFAAVESAWFRIAATLAESPTGEPSTAEFPAVDSDRVVPAETQAEPDPWSSPGDSGWRAAQAASVPTSGGTTASGLPKRAPRDNLIPGSVSPLIEQPPAAPVSAEKVRSRLSSFQEGVRKARNELPNREN